MSSGRAFPIGWAAWILVLLSAGLAAWAFNQRRQAQAEIAELTTAQSTLDSAIKHAQMSIERRNRTKAPVSARAQAAESGKAKGRPDIDAIISSHPDLLATYVKAIRGYTEQTYGALFARLRLAPDQIDRLETLIVNDLENQLDLESTAQAQGLSNDDPAIVKEREQQTADLQSAEQDLLGQDAYDAYHTATRAEAIRGTVEQVSYMTQFSANPLTGDQSEQLVQLMAQASGDFRNGKDATANSVDWDTVMAQAPSFLAPSQVATLQGVAQLNRFRALARAFDSQQAPAK
jgi:hypothetical protein